MRFSLAAFAILASTVTAQVSVVPSATITAFTPSATGITCGGIQDRVLQVFAGTQAVYRPYCGAQSGGFAQIPGAIYAASNVGDCVYYANTYNAQANKAYVARAAIYTRGDKKCQLIWKSNGNITPRADSDYLVAVNFA